MKMKKMVSAVSALTLAVSAFAGLTTVANADVVTADDGTKTTTFVRDYTTYTEDSGVDGWTATDSKTTTITVSDGIKGAGSNASNSMSKVISSEEESFEGTITGTIVWNNGQSTGNAGNYNYLTLTDSSSNKIFEVQAWGQAQNSVVVTGTNTTTWATKNAAYVRNNCIWTIDFTLDMDTKTIKSLVVTPNVGTAKANITNESFISSDVSSLDTITTGLYRGGSASGNYNIVKSINITSVVKPETKHTITTEYKLADGTKVLDDSKANIAEGKSFTPNYSTTFDDDNYRYTYVSNTTIESVTKDETVEVIYSREALADHSVSIKATGELDQTIGETYTVKDGKTVRVYVPKYVVKDGVAYKTTGPSDSGAGYYKSVTNVTEDTTVEVAYTKAYEGVVFYSEAEDIDTLTATSVGAIEIRCSSGKAAYAAEDAKITTLPAGKYQIIAACYGNAGTTFNLYAGDTETGNNVLSLSTNGNPTDVTSDEFTLNEATDIIVGAAGNAGTSPKVLDYIIIVKTGDAEVAPAELPTPDVKQFGNDYTGVESAKPARAYTASFTLNEDQTAAGLTWIVNNENYPETEFTTVTGGSYVYGLVIEADDLGVIDTVSAELN